MGVVGVMGCMAKREYENNAPAMQCALQQQRRLPHYLIPLKTLKALKNP